MCNHHHGNSCQHGNCSNHGHEHHHGKSPLLRIAVAFIIFGASLLLPLPEAFKLGLFVIAYVLAGGDVVYQAVRNILKGNVFDENFLMSIATIGAFAIKEYPEAVMVMILYQTGEYLQHRAVEKSRRSISQLMNIRPDYATIEKNGQLIKIKPEDVAVGTIIIVKSGEKIPLDSEVIEGKAILDTSALTGESHPQEIKAGGQALSGSINTNGMIKIKVSKTYDNSTVAKILELVEHAEAKKSRTENFITRFARYYTPAVVAGAVLLTALPPLLVPDAVFSVWFERALTFLVISCPCALVLSVPLSFFAGIGGASRNGILIKGGNYMEVLSQTKIAVFDKTGTLTEGSFKVISITPSPFSNENELLETAAWAECFSNHPIAISLKNAYGKKIDNTRVKEVEEIAGQGVKAKLDGVEIMAGSRKLFEQINIKVPEISEKGTVVLAAKASKYLGYIVIGDEIKTNAAAAVQRLNNMSIETVMLTGDTYNTAQNVAEKLGIQKFYANLLPGQKVEKLEELMRNGQGKVIFAGDGINDAPVLTRADVGIAMGGLGSDAAIEAADVVIMDDDPSKIVLAVRLSQKTLRIVKQNIIFALGVKGLFLVLGAVGMMTMWGAVFADVGVSVIAVLNSLRALNVKER